MAAPDGLSVGDTYISNGLEYQVVVAQTEATQYQVRLIGVASINVTFDALFTRTDSVLIVIDPENQDYEGLWAFVNGNYEKQSATAVI